jgi:hypothetical protein
MSWDALVQLRMQCETDTTTPEAADALFLKRLRENPELDAFWRRAIVTGSFHKLVDSPVLREIGELSETLADRITVKKESKV